MGGVRLFISNGEAPPETRWGTAGRISGGGEVKFVDNAGKEVTEGEVEEICHPKVADVALVVMPDHVMGERVCTFIEPQEGAECTFIKTREPPGKWQLGH